MYCVLKFASLGKGKKAGYWEKMTKRRRQSQKEEQNKDRKILPNDLDSLG